MDEALKADKDIFDVRDWLRTETDDEPTITELKSRVMPDNMYGDAAEWFLISTKFLNWCDLFLSSEVESSIRGTLTSDNDSSPSSCTHAMRQPSNDRQLHGSTLSSDTKSENVRSSNDQASGSQGLDSKRVLWVRGGYGTGKTTLLYHAHNALASIPLFQLVGTELRVVSYFCDAGKTGGTRPNHETILRALLYHISLKPDFRMAEPAQKLYNLFHSRQISRKEPVITEWEKLFKDIVAAGIKQYHFVFIVDALDECENLPEAERFLEFMSEVMRDNMNISFLCSSHQHVRIWRYFGKDNKYYGQDILEELEMSEKTTAKDIEKFIDGELARRKKGASESAFCKYPLNRCYIVATNTAPR